MIFLKEGSLTSREVYDYYRENREYISKSINQYNYFVKAVGGMFAIIKKMMIESEGGVYIEGLGYFAYMKSPRKRRKRGSYTIRDYTYTPYFFPDEGFSHWTMSDTFYLEFKVRSKETKRKLHFDLCESISAARKNANRYDLARPYTGKDRNLI